MRRVTVSLTYFHVLLLSLVESQSDEESYCFFKLIFMCCYCLL